MRNKIISSIVALGMATTINATPLFINDVDNNYRQFHNEIIKLFNDDGILGKPLTEYRKYISLSYPKMNVFENEKNYVFKFELAGIEKKDIKVTITDENVLTVTGEKKELSKDEQKNLIRQEHYYGSFARSISLPDDIDSNKIKVKYDNGILKVTIDKDAKKIKKGIRNLSID